MKHAWFISLAALSVSACVGLPPTRSADVRVPAQFDAPRPAGGDVAVLDRWWANYNDPELQRLIERALVNAPDAKTADARLAEARAQRNANRRLAYPTGSLTGNASDTYSKVVAGDLLNFPGFSNSGSSQSYSANFDVSWEIDLFGRVREGNRLIDSDYAATRFNIEGSRAALAAAVADSLFAARGLALQLEDARETAQIRTELNDILKKRVERGLAAGADADRTASDLAQSQALITQGEADLRAARRQLLVLVGDGTAPIDTLAIQAVVETPPEPPATVPGDLLRRRPDVREAEMRVAAAISQYKVDELQLFPRFTLRPGVGLTRTDQPSFSSTTASWTLGVGASVPVLDRPRLKQLAKVSGARAEEAVIAYEKTVQTAYAEAENALVLLNADRSRVAVLTAGEASARSAFNAAQIRYRGGVDTLDTLLNVQQSWRVARTALTNAQIQALRRSVQTFKALGGGWTPPPGGAA